MVNCGNGRHLVIGVNVRAWDCVVPHHAAVNMSTDRITDGHEYKHTGEGVDNVGTIVV